MLEQDVIYRPSLSSFFPFIDYMLLIDTELHLFGEYWDNAYNILLNGNMFIYSILE
jgi:hypothetical protein